MGLGVRQRIMLFYYYKFEIILCVLCIFYAQQQLGTGFTLSITGYRRTPTQHVFFYATVFICTVKATINALLF